MRTGYVLVDGSEALKRAPAVPRHWLAAAVIVIVAHWLWWQSGALWSAAAEFIAQRGAIGGAHAFVLSSVLDLLMTGALVAGLALYFSRRIDGRRSAAPGLNGASLAYCVVWCLAGLVVAIPHFADLTATPPRLDTVMQAVAVLTPATIMQAGSEEIVFRGIVLASLSARYGVRTGILVSAILFGLWHVGIGRSALDNVVEFTSAFVFGVTAALLALHYGNLGPSLALHIVWNVTSYIHAGVANGGDDGFWTAWLTSWFEGWTADRIADGDFAKLIVMPLAIETFIVYAACRDTVHRLLGVRTMESA